MGALVIVGDSFDPDWYNNNGTAVGYVFDDGIVVRGDDFDPSWYNNNGTAVGFVEANGRLSLTRKAGAALMLLL